MNAPVRELEVLGMAGLHVYADGCCEPNPGPGGWGVVAYVDGVEVHTETGGELQTTNNAMELSALLAAIYWASSRPESCVIWSDSMYSVKGANEWRHRWKANGWKRKGEKAKDHNRDVANLDLWRAIDNGLTSSPSIEIRWCRGHSGIRGNERADELALIGWNSSRPETGLITENNRT